MEELLMNGVEVHLKNPGTAGLKDFLVLGRSMSKVPSVSKKGKTKEQIEEEQNEINSKFMDYLDDKALDSAINLIKLTVKKTFPEWNDDIDAWTMTNAMMILPRVIKMCSPDIPTDDENRKEEVMARLTNAKST